MVERRKKLSNVKSNNTCFKSFGPASTNNVSKKYTSILSGPLDNTTKLVGVKNIMLHSIKLKMLRKHFLNEFPNCIEKYNGTERLGRIISWLPWFGNNN